MKLFDKIEYKCFKERNKAIGRKLYEELLTKEPVYGLQTNAEPVIVSMASYAARYKTILPTLKSLVLQTCKPDRIIVWLDEEKPENAITEEMKAYEAFGVEYRYTKDQLMPHKKYLYTMQEYPDAMVITVDDDLVYSPDMVESLLKAHKAYPDCVCARRVHQIRCGADGKVLPYKEWGYEYRKEKKPSWLLCPTGGAGTLYPAGILPEETFDIEKIKTLCHRADDIWLKMMELKAGVKAVWVPTPYVMPYEVQDSQEKALYASNANAGGNDVYIQKLLEVYPEIMQYLQ